MCVLNFVSGPKQEHRKCCEIQLDLGKKEHYCNAEYYVMGTSSFKTY